MTIWEEAAALAKQIDRDWREFRGKRRNVDYGPIVGAFAVHVRGGVVIVESGEGNFAAWYGARRCSTGWPPLRARP